MAENTLVSTAKASWWSLTINNPTTADYESLEKENLPSFVRAVKYQTEQGESGTIHIQIALNTTQVRFSQVKKWFPRAHIEIARDVAALKKYVEKEDTRLSDKPSGDIKTEFMTMEKCLVKFVDYFDKVKADPYYNTDEFLYRAYNHRKEAHWEETHWYWEAVKLYLQDSPNLVSVLTNPQMLRAWIHTRGVWQKIAQSKKSTCRAENDSDYSVDD